MDFQMPEDDDADKPMVKEELPDEAPHEQLPTLVKPVAPVLIPSDEDVEEADTPPPGRATTTSGEPQREEHSFAPESYETDHHWDPAGRPPWQRHSELGPNIGAEGKRTIPEAMQESVNPEDFDYHAAGAGVDVSALRATWDQMLVTDTAHSDVEKKRTNSMTICNYFL